MSQALSLSPVQQTVFAALNTPAVTDLATGGVFDDVPEGVSFPFLLFSLGKDQDYGGLGTSIGSPNAQRLRLRLYAYTQGLGFKTAQAIISAAHDALAPTQQTSPNGWRVIQIPNPEDAIESTDQLIAGQKAQELASNVYLDVEPAS